MDSYSGKFPLDFISFCLDMTSERQIEANEPQTTDPALLAQDLSSRQHSDNFQLFEEDGTARPLSNLSSSSGNTEESLSAFADQTLRTLVHLGPSLDITILSAPNESFQ